MYFWNARNFNIILCRIFDVSCNEGENGEISQAVKEIR